MVAKFSENEELEQYLKNTGTKELAEANVNDKFWGTGLSIWSKDALNIRFMDWRKSYREVINGSSRYISSNRTRPYDVRGFQPISVEFQGHVTPHLHM